MFKFSQNILKNVCLSCKILSLSYNPKLFYSNLTKVYEKSFQVHPGFGNLKLKSNCNCIIQPADSQCFPDSNNVQVIIWNKSLESDNPKVNIELSEKNDYISADIETAQSEYLCQLFIPVKYDVDAIMENGASLNIKSLESSDIGITSAKGPVKTENIKAEDFTVTMEKASLSLDGAFQGNLHINAKELNFQAKRLQGENLIIQTSHLDTNIESSYMTRGNIFADRGNLNIKNLHGSTYLHLLNGNLSVNGLHGKLMAFVNEGKLNIHISEIIDDSLIELKKGSIDLTFTDLSNKNVKVVAPQLEVHSDLIAFGSHSSSDGMQNFVTTFNNGPTLHVEVKSGTINLSSKDWFSSLGIKSGS